MTPAFRGQPMDFLLLGRALDGKASNVFCRFDPASKLTEAEEASSPASVNARHSKVPSPFRLLDFWLWSFGTFIGGRHATTPARTLLLPGHLHLYHLLHTSPVVIFP